MLLLPLVLLLSSQATLIGAEAESTSRPNIVMIAIDDLNDWIEPLEGHPDVKTPAMKR